MASIDPFNTELLALELDLVANRVEDSKLIKASELLTPQLFDDIVEDRGVSELCGYPSCPEHILLDRRFVWCGYAAFCDCYSAHFHCRTPSRLSSETPDAAPPAMDRRSFCSDWCFKVRTFCDVEALIYHECPTVAGGQILPWAALKYSADNEAEGAGTIFCPASK